MLNAKLVVVGGDARAKEVTLRLPTVIGRGKDVVLTLPHPLVSRRHAEVFEKGGWLYVRDLGSLNGTYVNNRRIKGAQRLPPNHLLTLGNVTFRAVYDVQEPVATDPGDITQRNEDETVNFEEIEDALTARVSAEPAQDMRQNPVRLAAPTEPAPAIPTSEPNLQSPAKSVDAGQVEQQQVVVNAAQAVAQSIVPSDVVPQESPVEETGSSIFSGTEDFLTPEKSISISALEALPAKATPSSISAVAQSLEEFGVVEEPLAVESVEIDVDGARAHSPAMSDPDLGSFLKKMPR